MIDKDSDGFITHLAIMPISRVIWSAFASNYNYKTIRNTNIKLFFEFTSDHLKQIESIWDLPDFISLIAF